MMIPMALDEKVYIILHESSFLYTKTFIRPEEKIQFALGLQFSCRLIEHRVEGRLADADVSRRVPMRSRMREAPFPAAIPWDNPKPEE